MKIADEIRYSFEFIRQAKYVVYLDRNYRGADKSLARHGRKQARNHERNSRDFNNIGTRAVIKFYFPERQGAVNRYLLYPGADKSLVRPGRKQARNHERDSRDFNNIGTRAVIKLFFPAGQGAVNRYLLYPGADKSLVLPGRKQARGASSGTRAISTISIRELSSIFFSYKASRRRKFTPF